MIDTEIDTLEAVRARSRPANRTFLDHYLSLLGGADCARREDFDPTRLPAVLGRLVVYERRGADEFHIRLFGTKVAERLGHDATGTNLLDMVAYADKAAIRDCMHRLLDARLGHYSLVRDTFASGRRARVEIVRLPFLDRADAPNLVIACTEEVESTAYVRRGDRARMVAEPLESCFFPLRDA